MVVEGSTGTVDCCLRARASDFSLLPALPTTDNSDGPSCEEEVSMEIVHARCAGLDISKKDAKVCVRVAGAGRRKTTETVTTWSSMTNQILAPETISPSSRSLVW